MKVKEKENRRKVGKIGNRDERAGGIRIKKK